MRRLKKSDFPGVLGVIPARFASTRLPGKPLIKLLGKPMVQWVYEAAKEALPRVIVATDDFRIKECVEEFGGEAMMTPNSCTSGTDRMAFVASKIPARFYVNVQGDEPLMNPRTIRDTVTLAVARKAISTAATELIEEEKEDLSTVKVIVGDKSRAIYFSRGMIPTMAHGVTESLVPTYKHLGLYVYPKDQLLKFVKHPTIELEKTEKLEQLRAVYFGQSIYVALTDYDSIGVDTPKDLERVTELLLQSKKSNLNGRGSHDH